MADHFVAAILADGHDPVLEDPSTFAYLRPGHITIDLDDHDMDVAVCIDLAPFPYDMPCNNSVIILDEEDSDFEMVGLSHDSYDSYESEYDSPNDASEFYYPWDRQPQDSQEWSEYYAWEDRWLQWHSGR